MHTLSARRAVPAAHAARAHVHTTRSAAMQVVNRAPGAMLARCIYSATQLWHVEQPRHGERPVSRNSSCTG